MTILLTGSTGFVGRHLLKRLETLGHHVIRFTRDTTLVPDCWEYQPLDAIIHCAGEISDQTKMFESNVVLTKRLLTFARGCKVPKFIQIGSSSEYGNMTEPRREDALCVPVDLYSATKLASTALCQGFASQYDMDVVVARPFSLYGPGDTPRKLIPRLIRCFTVGEPMTVGPGRQDYIYIDDFIDGLILLLGLPREKTKGQIINFGTGTDATNQEVTSWVAMLTKGSPTNLTVTGGWSGHGGWTADASKARALGWAPKYDLRSGLSELIRRET